MECEVGKRRTTHARAPLQLRARAIAATRARMAAGEPRSSATPRDKRATHPLECVAVRERGPCSTRHWPLSNSLRCDARLCAVRRFAERAHRRVLEVRRDDAPSLIRRATTRCSRADQCGGLVRSNCCRTRRPCSSKAPQASPRESRQSDASGEEDGGSVASVRKGSTGLRLRSE